MFSSPYLNRCCSWFAASATIMLTAATAGAQLLPHDSAVGSHQAVIIGSDYQDSTITTSQSPPLASACKANTACYFVFSRVPLGKRLNVTQASCAIQTTGGDITFAGLILLKGNGTLVQRYQFLVPVKTATGFFSMNNTMLQLFREKERPLVEIGTTANVDVGGFCTISGQLLDTP